jgi:membrane-associated phospholipid phosphatase
MMCRRFAEFFVLGMVCWVAQPQSGADSAALEGLALVSVLLKAEAGRAALDANYKVTEGIETGTIAQPTLFPFAEQQQQALRDAFISSQNLAQLTDGLGTTLGSAYLARFHYTDQKHISHMPQSITDLFNYATAMTGTHSNSGKYLFANGTIDGKIPVPPSERKILAQIDGIEDVFGKAYNLTAGSVGADAYGNSRPFQTDPSLKTFSGKDYFNQPSGNLVYNQGPLMNLTDSPSYPSGHTTYGYTGAVLLAVLIPERYSEMIARGAEYGNDRVIMGSHYVMDVLGGRTLALYDMAHLLANDSEYMGRSLRGEAPIKDFRSAVRNARVDLVSILQSGCGSPLEVCAREDTGRFSDSKANDAFYNVTQTYSLPVVYPQNANLSEDIGRLAPEAGNLLTAAFPALSLNQADRILTETEGPGGGFLDNGSAFGVYSRLNLYAAAKRAKKESSSK